MIHLRRLWHGDVPLQVAFWNWAVLGGLVVNLTSSLLFLLLAMADQIPAAFIAGYAYSIPFNGVVCVGVWRSADRYQGDQLWAALAKSVTVIAMLVLTIT